MINKVIKYLVVVASFVSVFLINFTEAVEHYEPKYEILADKKAVIEDIKKNEEAQTSIQNNKDAILQQFAQQYPQEYAEYTKLPPEEQELMLQQIMGGTA
jgi:thiamine pyrophosphate-dependent acetolactate synthase large subunit-like protein